MDKRESVEFLHDRGYSRRMSTKLTDIALLSKSNRTFAVAFQEALEKARKKGAKDLKKRKKPLTSYRPLSSTYHKCKDCGAEFDKIPYSGVMPTCSHCQGQSINTYQRHVEKSLDFGDLNKAEEEEEETEDKKQPKKKPEETKKPVKKEPEKPEVITPVKTQEKEENFVPDLNG